MRDYLNANIRGFGIGTNITNKNMIENNDWPAIRKLAESYTAVIQNG
jgi:2-keto-3-deoxy-6-phosphogluconate aldolase